MAIAPQRCRHQPAETSTSRLLGVFVLLSFQFRSYVEPLIVMIAIPFALIGMIWGHLLMGVDLSLPSMLGVDSLFSPHFSPGFVARVRKGGAGKARRTIRPQACFLHSEDRTVRRNAVQRRFYGLAAGSW